MFTDAKSFFLSIRFIVFAKAEIIFVGETVF